MTVIEPVSVIEVLPKSKAIGFTSCFTYDEFLRSAPELSEHIRERNVHLRLTAEEQDFFCMYPEFLNFVALISEDAPDSWIILPIWEHIARACARFDLRVLSDDDELEQLTHLLGEPDISAFLEEHPLPLLLIFDEEWHLQAQWGPHPQAIDAPLEHWLSEHPTFETLAESVTADDHADYLILSEQLAFQMRIWYNGGLAKETVSEIRTLLASLHAESPDEEGDEDEGVK